MIKIYYNNYHYYNPIIKYINNNNNNNYTQIYNIIKSISFCNINNNNNNDNIINKRYYTISNEKYDPHPLEIKLTEKGQRLEIKFDDIKESKYSFSSEYLRIETPSVEKGKSIISGKRNIKINKIERVGNYAIRLIYSDHHETGIYSWEYLYKLGKTKFSRMKKYLKDIKLYNRSRDPEPPSTQNKQQLIEKILKNTSTKENK